MTTTVNHVKALVDNPRKLVRYEELLELLELNVKVEKLV